MTDTVLERPPVALKKPDDDFDLTAPPRAVETADQYQRDAIAAATSVMPDDEVNLD